MQTCNLFWTIFSVNCFVTIHYKETSELDDQDFIDEDEEKKGPQKKIRPGNSYGPIDGEDILTSVIK